MGIFKKKKEDNGNEKPQDSQNVIANPNVNTLRNLPVKRSQSAQSITREPIPEIDELNYQFRQVLEELAIPLNERDAMMSMAPERKWKFIRSHKMKSNEPPQV